MRKYLQLVLVLLCSTCLNIEVSGQLMRGVKLVPKPAGMGSNITRIVAEDTSLFWINLATSPYMLGRFENGSWQNFTAQQLGITQAAVRDMMKHDGKIWMATPNGLHVFTITGGTPALVNDYNSSNGLPSNEVRSIDAQGSRVAVATDAGLAVLEAGNWTVYSTTNGGFTSNRVGKVRMDANNIVAVTDSGVSIRTGTQNWVHYDLNFLGETTTTALHAAPFGTGGVMVASTNAVSYIIGNTKIDLTQEEYYKAALAPKDMSVVNGSIWSISAGGIQTLTNKRELYALTTPVSNTRLNFDGRGGIYYVAIQGLYRVDSTTFYSDRSSAINSAFLDIGNYKMLFTAKGDFFWDTNSGNSAAEYPKRTNLSDPKKTVAFAGALWIGGLNAGGTLHASTQTYRQTSMMGHNFWPGPLNANGTIDTATQRKFDRVWKVNRFDIETFREKHQLGQLNDPNYRIPDDMLEWPAHRPGSNTVLAPFVDVNSDGNYNLMDGDYPDIKGDQMLWWIYNDVKTGSRGILEPPLGVEIAVSVYGFTCENIQADSSVLNTSFLMNLKVTNKSANTYTNTSLGLFQDVDLGNGSDDFVGCHVPLNTVYTYNGDDDDQGIIGYGLNMPAFGTTILKGPLAPQGDGKDNNRNGVIDEAGEDIGLTNHHFFNNDGTVIGNPVNGMFAYNYMTGKWRDSSSVVYGGNGYAGSAGATNFTTSLMFPGNSDMTIGWGLGGTTQTPIVPPFAWSETTPGGGAAPNTPADRRNIAAMSGFTFLPDETQDITVAFIISRSSQNGAAASVTQLFADIPKVKHWFQTGNFPSCLDLSNVSVDELETGNQLQVYPNPANDQLFVRDEAGSDAQLVLMNMQGSQIRTGQLVAGEAVFNLQDVPAGVYFLQATSANKKQVYKVVVSR